MCAKWPKRGWEGRSTIPGRPVSPTVLGPVRGIRDGVPHSGRSSFGKHFDIRKLEWAGPSWTAHRGPRLGHWLFLDLLCRECADQLGVQVLTGLCRLDRRWYERRLKNVALWRYRRSVEKRSALGFPGCFGSHRELVRFLCELKAARANEGVYGHGEVGRDSTSGQGRKT